jgi:hypothetical protein
MGFIIATLILIYAQGVIIMCANAVGYNDYKIDVAVIFTMTLSLIWPITATYKLIKQYRKQ